MRRARCFRRGGPEEYRIAQSDWWIELFSDGENAVPPGDVEIHSELNDVPQPGYRGAKTTLIEREPSVTAARVARDRESTRRQADQVFAEIRYRTIPAANLFRDAERDQRGTRRRGLWVDLPLYTSDEVRASICVCGAIRRRARSPSPTRVATGRG